MELTLLFAEAAEQSLPLRRLLSSDRGNSMFMERGDRRGRRRENTAHVEKNGALQGDKGRRGRGDFLAAIPLSNDSVRASASNCRRRASTIAARRWSATVLAGRQLTEVGSA